VHALVYVLCGVVVGLGVPLLDHIIVAQSGYYSYLDNMKL
jgi:DNA repair protein RadC